MDTEEVKTLENDGFTPTMVEKSRRNSSVFGASAAYVREAAEPAPMPPGNRRRTVHGGVTLNGETCYV